MQFQNQEIEERINHKCSDSFGKQDFTVQDIEYLHSVPSFRDEMLCWFGTSMSDGCWTPQTVKVMMRLATAYNQYIPFNDKWVENFNE
jgi:hypothetical protein